VATRVRIPNTGDKETTGTIGMWFKSEGETVQEGEPLCTIETQKASVEIEAPCSGILRRIITPRDTLVSVGDCIAIIASPTEDISALEEELLLQK
jgi:pyruvate dehydrogenase E2 component (dihydrolipoamide acetyltransferase)